MKDFLELLGKDRIINFVGKHKISYNDICLKREQENVVKVTVEIWDRYDDNDQVYEYYYGPYGEIEKTSNGYLYVPFNDETKEWFKMVLRSGGVDVGEYVKGFKGAHTATIGYKTKQDVLDIDKQVEQLQLKRLEIMDRAKSWTDEMVDFVIGEHKAFKEQNSLLVKAFFENMTQEEREEWLKQNGFKSKKVACHEDQENILNK